MKKKSFIKEIKRILSIAESEAESKSVAKNLEDILKWVDTRDDVFDDVPSQSTSSLDSPELPSESKNHPEGSVVVFSDGACRGNPGPGAWGAVVQVKSGELLLQRSGVQFNTTNNQMELLGAIEGLSSVLDDNELKGKEVILISDSRYVVDGLKSWVAGWKKRGWKKSDGKPPENLDLWMQLDQINQELNGVHLYWVKGHSGHPQNELCDQLANEALDEAGL